MLVYMETMLQNEALKDVLKIRATQIIKNILIPSCRWKAGQVNLKIRKSSIICMIHLIKNHIIHEEELLKVRLYFTEISALYKLHLICLEFC